MALGYDFGKGSPYMQRKDRTFGRSGGRPFSEGMRRGGESKLDYMRRSQKRNLGIRAGGIGTTGEITGGVDETTPPTTTDTTTGGTGSGVSGTIGQSPYAGFLKSLTQPIQYQDRSQQRFNIAREQIQAGTKIGMEQARTALGGKGFRGGESGIADTALGGLAARGSERLSLASRQIQESEADRAQAYDAMNLQRKLGGAGIALTGEEGAMNRMMQYYQSKLGAETQEWQPWWQGQAGGY